MAEREIDWASAEVKGSSLSVGFSGDSEDAKKWSERMQTVLRVLDRSGGKWGEIKVSKEKIQVADLHEGAEPDLRHLLESAVLQANTDLAPDDDAEDDERDNGDDDDEQSGDQEMTRTFRSFASGSDADDDEDGDADEQARDSGERKKRGD